MPTTASTRRRRLGALAIAVALTFASGCADNQDPGLVDSPGSGADTTSNTLGQCPPGGPDETTTPAGCIGADGQVQRP